VISLHRTAEGCRESGILASGARESAHWSIGVWVNRIGDGPAIGYSQDKVADLPAM
jgi:hypothetical protein